ncbi:MAG: hypothetical protein KA059_00690 [Elusimicrobiales bacterium]|nr:hypothetical protein [Elusimicrobiales bacterium]NLH38724.1 hypothetical protein [Elusimicrobiota bacterium]
MKKLLLSVVFVSSTAFAAENELGLVDFNNVKSEINTPAVTEPKVIQPTKTEIPTITKSHLIANTSKKIIIGYAKTDTEYKEFTDMYTKLLKDNGFKISEVKKDGEMIMITYLAHDEKGVRRFIGDALTYNGKDDAEITKLMNETAASLESNGMKVIGKYLVKVEELRPTFMIYYLTDVKDAQENEIRLRLLNKGEDIDYELIENSVNIIRKDSSFKMLYIGKELGFVSKLAADDASAKQKLDEYKKFLKDNKKDFINYKIKPLDEPFTSGSVTYNVLLNIYFFQ